MKKVSLESIEQQLASDNSRDRLLALASLREVEPQDAVPLIKTVLYDPMLPVRSMAVFALGVKVTDECYPLLLELLSDDDYSIRADAAGALGYLGDPRALEPLMRSFYEDTQWLVQFSAAVALGNLRDPKAKQVLLKALESQEPVIQQAAIAALGEIQAIDTLDKILNFASSQDWLIRQRIAEALGNLPSEKSMSALKFMVKDNHPQVRQAAEFSLNRLAAV
jgi:HEAT repeat protein